MRSSRTWAAVFLVLVVILLNLPATLLSHVKAGASDNVAPLENIMGLVLAKARDSVVFLLVAGRAVREREELRAEIATLRHAVRAMRNLREENSELREQLGFKKRDEHRLVSCRILAEGGTSGWWQTVRLNRGAGDGIGPDMAVVTPDGLIGRTVSVSRDTADVLLITDPNCRVSCVFPRTGAFGIARGQGVTMAGERNLEIVCGARSLQVNYVDKEDHILPGEEVVTSGLGGVFPKGLLLGRVLESEMDRSGLFRRVRIAPGAGVRGLRYAFVVVPE